MIKEKTDLENLSTKNDLLMRRKSRYTKKINGIKRNEMCVTIRIVPNLSCSMLSIVVNIRLTVDK